MLTHRSLLILLLWTSSILALAREGRNCTPNGKVRVECSQASSFITLDIQHCRRIGKVVMEVRDLNGRTLYREEGRALTGTLIRRLDKGAFPHGDLVLTVTTRDFRFEQAFVVR